MVCLKLTQDYPIYSIFGNFGDSHWTQMLSSCLGQEVWLEGPSRGWSSVLPAGKLQKVEWSYSEQDICSYFAIDEVVCIILRNRNPVKTVTDTTL